jgi:hypothetical protein
MATAKAKVVTARNWPDTRKAGRPRTRAMAPPATADRASDTNRSVLWSATRLAVTTAPTPMTATWPRLTTPPQPVSTTNDSATSA